MQIVVLVLVQYVDRGRDQPGQQQHPLVPVHERGHRQARTAEVSHGPVSSRCAGLFPHSLHRCRRCNLAAWSAIGRAMARPSS